MSSFTREEIRSHLSDTTWLYRLIKNCLPEYLEPIVSGYHYCWNDANEEADESTTFFPEKGIFLIELPTWHDPINVPGMHPNFWTVKPRIYLLDTGELVLIESRWHSFCRKASFFNDETIKELSTARRKLTSQEYDEHCEAIAKTVFHMQIVDKFINLNLGSDSYSRSAPGVKPGDYTMNIPRYREFDPLPSKYALERTSSITEVLPNLIIILLMRIATIPFHMQLHWIAPRKEWIGILRSESMESTLAGWLQEYHFEGPFKLDDSYAEKILEAFGRDHVYLERKRISLSQVLHMNAAELQAI